jgi:hypothetical protein
MKRGHPTNKERADTRKTLFEYWSKNRSALFTAEDSGINVKTVNAYFKEFASTITEEMNQDFIEKQKAVKAQAVKAMDALIIESETQLSEIKEKCEDDPENTGWENIRASIIKDQMAFINEKANLEISPTLDVDLDSILEKKVAQSSASPKKAET